jgi:hypothetical protein
MAESFRFFVTGILANPCHAMSYNANKCCLVELPAFTQINKTTLNEINAKHLDMPVSSSNHTSLSPTPNFKNQTRFSTIRQDPAGSCASRSGLHASTVGMIQTLQKSIEQLDHTTVDVVVVDNVDQKVRIMDRFNHLTRKRAFFIQRRPLRLPQLECFVLHNSGQCKCNTHSCDTRLLQYLPNWKTHWIYHGWLDNLLRWEDTPCHCIGRHLHSSMVQRAPVQYTTTCYTQ